MRFLKSSKRNALISSIIFLSFYVIFQFWNHYNIVNKTPRELGIRVEEEIFPFEAEVMLATAGHETDQLRTVVALEASESFWSMVERNVNMTYQREFNYTSQVVHPMFAHLYWPNEEGMLVCYYDKRLIHSSRVNDDYCDCLDGSDEPSTAACRNGRFYCKYQSVIHDLMWIRSNLVGDGVCDCPDGSDEPKPFKVPSLEPSKSKEERSCRDTTQEMLEKERSHVRVHSIGARVKRDWIANVAENAEVLNNKLYGARGEFYEVKASPCLMTQRGRYSYTVCPFGESTQNSYNGMVVIGRSPSWLKYDGSEGDSLKFRHKNAKRDNYILVSDGGDAKNCPQTKPRKTIIKFTCDVQNRIVEVSERETCTYSIEFGTPAAC